MEEELCLLTSKNILFLSSNNNIFSLDGKSEIQSTPDTCNLNQNDCYT